MTQHEAESAQACNVQSLSVSRAAIFPTLGQKSATTAVILLMAHHLTTLQHGNIEIF